MFKIGEFSQLGQVSTRMLRHYDKLGLLQPNHTDQWTGYRYYTLDQLSRLHRIMALKDLGLSLAQISDLLGENGELSIEQLRGMLLLKQNDVQREVTEGQMRLRRIEARLDQLDQTDRPSPYEVAIKSVASLTVASVRVTVPHIAEMGFYCESLTHQIYCTLREAQIRPIQPELILYHATEYTEIDVEVEAAVAVHPKYGTHAALSPSVGFRELRDYQLAAALIYEGAHRDITPAVLELLRWVATNQHVPAGPLREIHLSGPAHEDGAVADDAVTELLLPIIPSQPGNG
jgi:DNA-binding transcriptional MerR regulator